MAVEREGRMTSSDDIIQSCLNTALPPYQTNAAYLLFYQRQDKIRQPTLPAPTDDGAASPTQAANDVTSSKHDSTDGATPCVTMETD